MPSYTANKNLIVPAYNEYALDQFGWSTPINQDWAIIDKAFGGTLSLNAAGSTSPVAIPIADAQNLILDISGAQTVNKTFTLPAPPVGAFPIIGGQWIVRNATTGTGTVTISPVSGGGASVVVPRGQIEIIYSDGTNIRSTRSTADRFPVGGIVMWSGTIATIPTGWFLCNGSNGTPDLRDRFIIGATQDDAGVAKTNITGSLTQTGGSKDAIVVSHTHTATVTDPGHGHQFIYGNATQASANQTPTGGFVLNSVNSAVQNANTANATVNNQIGANTTGITVANSTTGASGTDANLVPYYALAYIMRGAY